MGGLSFSSWIILILGFIICFGGAFYCLLIIWGKDPNRFLEMLGITGMTSAASETIVNAGIYRPFEYMEQGPKEKGVGVLVVFILLTIGWGLGVFDSGDAEGEGRAYLVEIGEETVTFAQEGEYCDEGETIEYYYNFTQENLLSVSVILTWDDDTPGITDGDNDLFRLEWDYEWNNDVPGSGGGSSSEGSESGEIIFVRETTIEIPNGSQYQSGSSAREVREEFTFTENGEYFVNVTCEDAGDRDPTPFGQDDGNNFDLEIRITYYVVTVTESHLPS